MFLKQRCAEQQWGCSEDGEIEDPTWTKRQGKGRRTRGGGKWIPGWAKLHSSSWSRHGRWAKHSVSTPLLLPLNFTQNAIFLSFQLSHRRRRWDVQSGWIIDFHLSKSQTWTQHGPDRWEPPVPVLYHYFHSLLTFFRGFRSQLTSWLGLRQKRWPSTRPPTLNRPLPRDQAAVSLAHFFMIRIVFGLHKGVLRLSLCIPDQRSGSRTPQRVSINMWFSFSN